MRILLRDLRRSFRKAVQTPGLTLILILLLTLGISAATVVFSLYNTVLFRALPVENPSRLVALYTSGSSGQPYSSSSYPDYLDLRESVEVFSDILAYQTRTMSFSAGDGTERVDVEMVSGNYFPLLGVETVVGRTFDSSEVTEPGTGPLAVLGHEFWQRRFSGDPGVVGREVRLGEASLTVIGVAPPGFRGIELPTSPALFVPLTMANEILGGDRLGNRGSRWIDLVGRLAPDASLEQARQSVPSIFERISEVHPESNEGRQMSLLPVQSAMIYPPDREEALDLFTIALAAVVLFLLAICTNVASILLARGLARQQEMAVQVSIGAGKWRILGEQMVENVATALVAGLLALPLAGWLLRIFSSIDLPVSYPFRLEFTLDFRVFGFSLLFSLLLGALLGLLPALRSLRFDVVSQLKQETRGGTARRTWVWDGLVIIQIAATLVLLITAGLFVRSLQEVRQVDPGFQAGGTLIAGLEMPGLEVPEEAESRVRDLIDRFSQMPGVERASLVLDRPLSPDGRRITLWIPGMPAEVEELEDYGLNMTTPGFFDLMGMSILQGRDFSFQDRPESAYVVVVNRRMVELLWPDGNPLGATMRLGGPEGIEFQVVGVVEDAKYRSLREEPQPYAYMPLLQHDFSEANLLLESRSSPLDLRDAMRKEVAAFDPDIAVFDVTTLEGYVDKSLSRERMSAVAMSSLGLLSLLVGSLGIFGVMIYTVNRRNQEFGVRMSFGAGREEILKLVLRQVLLLTIVGLGLGLLGAVAASRVVESYLYGIRATDPLTFVVVPLVLAVAVFGASIQPIRKATRLDPAAILR